MEKIRPPVGVGTIIIKNKKIALGKDTRKGKVYGVPGGHWKSGETPKECSI